MLLGLALCTRSSTDRVPVFGTVDVGSIPAGCTIRNYSGFFVRLPGIEPGSRPWQGRVLPLNHNRFEREIHSIIKLAKNQK